MKVLKRWKLFAAGYFTLMILASSIHAQVSFGGFFPAGEIRPPKGIFVNAGISYQQKMLMDFNLVLAKTVESGVGLQAWRLGSEWNFNADDFVIAPKLGCEFTILILTARLNTLCYFSQGQRDWRFMPELGFSYFGIAYLTYGYSQPISGNEMASLGRHRIALSVNLSPKLWINVFNW